MNVEASSSFRFLMRGEGALDELEGLGVAHQQVLSPADGFTIGLHILPVTLADAEHFERRNHAREDGTTLNCLSIYLNQLGSTAFAKVTLGRAFAVVDGDHVARMACICDRLTPAIAQALGQEEPSLRRDAKLVGLLRRLANPTWADADRVAKNFPDPLRQGAPYGGYMAFHDLIRLIWVHEWAHILLGHVELVATMEESGRLDEHGTSQERSKGGDIDGVPYAHVRQSLELQADNFAMTFITHQILHGYDPAGTMAGPNINLIHRICALAAACAVFAVDNQMKQGKRDPNLAFHPGAALRYVSMLDTIESVCLEFDPRLGSVRPAVFGMIGDLAKLDEDFSGLLAITPMVARTPSYKSLCQVSDYLIGEVGRRMDTIRRPYVYFPRTA